MSFREGNCPYYAQSLDLTWGIAHNPKTSSWAAKTEQAYACKDPLPAHSL